MAGSLVALVVPDQSSYPVQTSWDQVYIHMLTCYILILHTYDIHIHSPRNDKRSSMPAESIGVPFCKWERNPCAWDSAVSQIQAIRGLGAACASGRRRADLMSRKGAMDLVKSRKGSMDRKGAMDFKGNDHLPHYNIATIPLVIYPVL